MPRDEFRPGKVVAVELTGLHLLLTYLCTMECEHCFVWGSPWQSGTMTLQMVDAILDQARELGTVRWIYFEGGEPFLFYPILLTGTRKAVKKGFQVGLVTNSYWATDIRDAAEWLKPLKGLVEDLSVSSDLFHYDEEMSREARNAQAAASKLGIPVGLLMVAQPEEKEAPLAKGQLPLGKSQVMCRGRATSSLTEESARQDWVQFTSCPHEDLRNPGRVHIDPLGHTHVCQGISLGNLLEAPLSEITSSYDPDAHPVIGPLLKGGPAELVRRYDLPLRDRYIDACHLCYLARTSLRAQFPDILTPDQMYGVPGR